MISIKLSETYENKLEFIAQNQKLPKEEMIKKVLRQFVDDYYRKSTPYELGKDLFGTHGSGKGSLSKDYKKELKEKLRDKHAH